jgi:formylglycine-generating enzyme
MTTRAALVIVACALSLISCSSRTGSDAADAGADGPPWSVAPAEAQPRPGMVWVPPGPLVAGTPLDKSPRVPDEEMNGEQIVMHGYYVDVYPYPNEQGALPKVGVTQAEAASACEAQHKRLCTELEIERACKGPQNTLYEYGEGHRPSVCGTGALRAPGPNGMSPACASGFGVHDLHGGAWTWTASAWKRDPSKAGLVAIRGGNGVPGELVGRCSNGRGVKPDAGSDQIGFRCCAGEANPFEVSVSVPRGEPLSLRPPDAKIAAALEKLAQSEASAPKEGRFAVERVWIWRPFGTEEIWIGGGCSGTIKSKSGKKRRAGCGIMLGREGSEAPQSLGFVATDRWQPTLTIAGSRREVFLYGGDEHGAFRRKIAYDWGKIALGEKARKKDGKGDVYE